MRALAAKTLTAALAITITGCAADQPDDAAACTGAKCDGFNVESALADRQDPIAEFLRQANVDSNGTLRTDYREVVTAIAEMRGCGTESIATFVVSDDLVEESAFPRLVSTVCADDDSKASEFFLAASFSKVDEETGEPTAEIDLEDLEMFAWDPNTRQYNFYATRPIEGEDRVQLEIDPVRCQQCHLTSSDHDTFGMPMTPVMNELNRPWTHWNAQPGFPSHDFIVPADTQETESYSFFVDRWQASASRLEEIIRFGAYPKVAAARARKRRDAPTVDSVMGMLRPVFCEEQVNYVTEDHDSGIIFNHTVVDLGIKNMFFQVSSSDWPWAWVNDQTMRLSAAGEGDPLSQVPVRGFADVIYEQQLVTVRALTAEQVLRVRALDWKRPVFSQFRCGLWESAYERYQSSPPNFGDATRISNVISDVFEDIMTVGGAPLKPADGSIIVLDEATPDAVAFLEEINGEGLMEAAECDSEGFCIATLDEFGARINVYMENFLGSDARSRLEALRNDRICHVIDEVAVDQPRFLLDDQDVAERFANRPSLPDVPCP